MRVWKKATGILKDKNSIWIAKLSRKSRRPWRNPDLETVIIKATSHDEQKIDCKNMQRVFKWLRTSPLYWKPLVLALTMRLQKTKSWVVALKGLMLIHGVLSIDLPMVPKIGRFPFNLSNFTDSHLSPSKAWGFNAFVRAYFAYLDQRSEFVSSEVKNKNKINVVVREAKVVDVDQETLMEELEKLQKLQAMIDMLLQIKPQNINMINNIDYGLILEAMDCVIVEVFDVYSNFCKRIAGVLLRIYDVGGKMEASIALKVLQKASVQGDELCFYFEFCRDIGVLNASQCPNIERISEEDIHDLERIIINGVSTKKNLEISNIIEEDIINNYKAIVVREDCSAKESKNGLMTVITHQWEVFDDDINTTVIDVKGNSVLNGESEKNIAIKTNPFEESYSLIPYLHVHINQVHPPDLISL